MLPSTSESGGLALPLTLSHVWQPLSPRSTRGPFLRASPMTSGTFGSLKACARVRFRNAELIDSKARSLPFARCSQRRFGLRSAWPSAISCQSVSVG